MHQNKLSSRPPSAPTPTPLPPPSTPTVYCRVPLLSFVGRIPPGAEVEYTLELVALPGKEEDLVLTRDDAFTGDAFDSA